ncbi:MAG: ATP-dependent RNA helicase RhlB [Desulfobulbaceae bacterium]|nr:ATP-dependent RNA helicase RhlB [Desulfobulbaceae bacterium]
MVIRLVNFIRKRLKKHTASKSALPDQQLASANEQPRPKRKRRRPKKKPAAPGQVAKATPQTRPADWDQSSFKVTPEEGKSRFHDFALPAEIMHAISDLDFKYCTPIQAESLPHTMQGSDIIGKAQTGTGKTAAFLVTILTDILVKDKTERPHGTPHSLIIAPTRELVMQIAKDAESLAKYTDINVVSVFGGVDYQKQQNKLIGKKVGLVVATPGRLLDFNYKRVIDLSKVKIMVIDEADRMLDMGFIPDVRKIVHATPNKDRRQTLFYSATITAEVNHLAAQWTKKPVTIEIEAEQVAVDTVEQIVYLTTAKDKYNLLYNTIINSKLERVIVFANRRDETRRLTERLKRNNISCAMLSGEVPQNKRTKTLEDFRNGKIRVLVATDVAGRGIHIDGVSHVINYTLPYESEDYVHRIGRTGRAGASGISISFACEEGSFYIPEIEAFIGAKLPCTTPEPELLKPAPKGTIKPEKRVYQQKKPSRNRSSHPPQRRR